MEAWYGSMISKLRGVGMMRILHEIRKFSVKILFIAGGLIVVRLLVFPNTLDVILLLLIAAVLVSCTYH